jgi:hypothetical protein
MLRTPYEGGAERATGPTKIVSWLPLHVAGAAAPAVGTHGTVMGPLQPAKWMSRANDPRAHDQADQVMLTAASGRGAVEEERANVTGRAVWGTLDS